MKFTTTNPHTQVYAARYGRGVVVRNDGQFLTVKFERDKRAVKFTCDGKDAAGNVLHFFDNKEGK